MTTAQGNTGQFHIENGQVFEGMRADATRVIDLNTADRNLVTAIKSEGHSSPSDWPDGDYRLEGNRLVSM